MKMLWLDDEEIRDPSPNWIIVRNADEAIDVLKNGDVEVISMDHDLGDRRLNREITGMDVVKWMIDNSIFPKFINIHSHNPDESKWMYNNLRRAMPVGTFLNKILFTNGLGQRLEEAAKKAIGN